MGHAHFSVHLLEPFHYLPPEVRNSIRGAIFQAASRANMGQSLVFVHSPKTREKHVFLTRRIDALTPRRQF